MFFFYNYDALGNVISLTNPAVSANKAYTYYTYDAFGNLLAKSGTSVTNPYQFQTKYTSPTIGLVNFGFRYYNHLIGRFITQDPLGMVDGPNLYVYLNNNPVNLIDPWGLCGVKPWWQSLWRHLYIDVGYTGLASGKLGGILNTGFIIAPSGIYYYYGVGIGGGGGVTATVNLGRLPSSSKSILFVGRYGSGIWGVKGSAGFSENNPIRTIGAGWGIGAGSGIVTKHTIQLIEW